MLTELFTFQFSNVLLAIENNDTGSLNNETWSNFSNGRETQDGD